ncbi:MAG TPA: VWA domain-containing protein [Bryobacteraceae bacterium]|jgi:VWFA-related protein
MKKLCVLLGMTASALYAQGVIRVETREVLVDVTVTGKGDTSNLTAKDFSVSEDGKQQKITSVTRAATNKDAAPKHFVIYLDFSMMPAALQSQSEEAAIGFIEAMASPDRYMAIASFGISGPVVLQNFTNAKEPLKKAAAAPLNLKPIPAAMMGGILGAGSKAGTVGLSGSLEAVCESLQGSAGRTSLILFTGTIIQSVTDFESTAKACNRSNTAIDAVAPPGGVDTGNASELGRSAAAVAGRVTIPLISAATLAQYLADSTGGRVFLFSSKLPEELASIAREQDDSYRLAYVPPQSKEGSCHDLRVKTSVKGAELRARREYCTEKEVDVVAGKIAGQALEAKAGSGNLNAAMALPWFYAGANRASVHLVVDMVPTGMKFEKDKDGLHGQIDLVGSAVRADGGTAARFADTVALDAADQQQADALLKKPYHYEHTFNIAPGDYKFQLSLGTGPNAVAKLEAPLAVAPWNGSAFAISSLVLSSETHPVEAEDAGSRLFLEGKAPLSAGGRVFVPSSATKFPRSAPFYLYAEIYDPGAAQGVLLQYRILDAKSGEIRGDSGVGAISSYIRPGNPLIPFATGLNLEKLPAGAYRLEVKAGMQADAMTAVRTVDFELE